MTSKINRLAIIGVGLIGGSLARALRAADAVGEIVGHGRHPNHLQSAVDLGVIDRGCVSVAEAAEEADLVVVATPVGAVADIFSQLLPVMSDDTVITDVGSVKQSVIADAREALADRFPQFVPGHPIAGTEQSGVEASFAELFEHHNVILTPEEDTDPLATARVETMWSATGAIVQSMDVVSHDEVMAACSHAPHVLAYALVDMLVRQDNHRQVFQFAAGGFRDFTRIASSSPEMWRDISLHNRRALVNVLTDYRDNLDELIQMIEAGDGEALRDTFYRAKHARDEYF